MRMMYEQKRQNCKRKQCNAYADTAHGRNNTMHTNILKSGRTRFSTETHAYQPECTCLLSDRAIRCASEQKKRQQSAICFEFLCFYVCIRLGLLLYTTRTMMVLVSVFSFATYDSTSTLFDRRAPVLASRTTQNTRVCASCVVR